MVSKNKQGIILYVFLGIFFVIAVNLYYLAAYFQTPDGWTFTGVNLFAAADKLIYYSMVEQGAEGIYMMKNLHTSEPQLGLFFSPHWWLIGQTGKLLGIGNIASYHLYRVLLTIAFLLVLYQLLKQLFKDPLERILGVAVVLFAGGWGWILALFNPGILVNGNLAYYQMPVDLYVTEAFPFSNFAQAPLFLLSHLLLILIFYLFVRWRHSFSWPRELIVGLLSFLLILIHPYDIWIIAFVLGGWTAWRFWSNRQWLPILKFLCLGIFLLAAAVYLWLTLRFEPAASGWLAQNLVYSPTLKNYLWGFGFILPLWLLGSWQVLKNYKNNVWWLLILIWSWMIWLLTYLPVSYNRRFANAWFIALALIAVLGPKYLLKQISNFGWRITVLAVIFLLLFLNNFISLSSQLETLKDIKNDDKFYIKNDWKTAFGNLKQNSSPQDIVLTNDISGSGNEILSLMVPAYTGRRVFIGHRHQTVDYLLKQQKVDQFWVSSAGDNKYDWLKSQSIDWLLIRTNNNQDYGWLNSQVWLDQKFSVDGLLIYQVL